MPEWETVRMLSDHEQRIEQLLEAINKLNKKIELIKEGKQTEITRTGIQRDN